jgi:hypothetical protein
MTEATEAKKTKAAEAKARAKAAAAEKNAEDTGTAEEKTVIDAPAEKAVIDTPAEKAVIDAPTEKAVIDAPAEKIVTDETGPGTTLEKVTEQPALESPRFVTTRYHEDIEKGKKVCRFPGNEINPENLDSLEHMQSLIDDGLAVVVADSQD